jgi:hypothetical protein
MDPIKNPFAPGAGSPPPELAGRQNILKLAEIALGRLKEGRPAKSLILVGLRGVGKTVLLVKMRELADAAAYKTISIEAHEGKSLPALLAPAIRQILFSLDGIASAKDMAKRGLRVLRSFLSGVKLHIGEVDIGLSIEPERGVADSGDLEADLGELFVALGEAAKAGQTAIGLFIDELQYLSEKEFSALIMAIHRTNQSQLPVVIFGAGLPQILGLAGESKSYAERLFDYPNVGALNEDDARAAIQVPTAALHVGFEPAAINEILRKTERYPYFLQQWGHEAWNLAEQSPITLKVVEMASDAAIKSLDESFFRVRFDRCTPSEKRYLHALAELGKGPQRSGEIAEKMNVKPASVGPVRSKLIAKGMIYSPVHGATEFTVPMFDEYMRRTMNAVKANGQ